MSSQVHAIAVGFRVRADSREEAYQQVRDLMPWPTPGAVYWWIAEDDAEPRSTSGTDSSAVWVEHGEQTRAEETLEAWLHP